MRHAVAMILGLLLVLRGLLGDAMAMGVAPATPAQPTIAAAATHHAMASDTHDHGGHDGDHASASAQPHCCDTGGAVHAEHPAGCSACGACHSAFYAPVWAPAFHARHDSRLQPHPGTHFASATAAQAIKPPIS